MNKKMYTFKGQYITMTDEEVSSALAAYEKSLQTDKVTYSDDAVIKRLGASLKTSIEPAFFQAISKKIREIAGENTAVTSTHIRKGLILAGEKIAQERAKNSNYTLETETKNVAGDLALSLIFGVALNFALKNDSAARKYIDNGPLIRVKQAFILRKMVITLTEVEAADFFVFSFFSSAYRRALLLGFASKEDVKSAKKGNYESDPDNCPWNDLSYYIPLEKLKPMSDFYSYFKLSAVPTGVAFESIPSIKQIPVLAGKELQEMLQNAMAENSVDADKFDILADLGISSPLASAVTPPAKAEPVPEKQIEKNKATTGVASEFDGLEDL